VNNTLYKIPSPIGTRLISRRSVLTNWNCLVSWFFDVSSGRH